MGKMKFKIKNINLATDQNLHDYLESFSVENDKGENLNINPYSFDLIHELDNLSQDEIIEWGKDKIGKYIFTEGIKPYGFMAVGKTYII